MRPSYYCHSKVLQDSPRYPRQPPETARNDQHGRIEWPRCKLSAISTLMRCKNLTSAHKDVWLNEASLPASTGESSSRSTCNWQVPVHSPASDTTTAKRHLHRAVQYHLCIAHTIERVHRPSAARIEANLPPFAHCAATAFLTKQVIQAMLTTS